MASRATPACRLVVGHEGWRLRGHMGAYSALYDMTEWEFNQPLAEVIGFMVDPGVCSVEVDHYTPGADIARWQGGADFQIEMHLNSHRRTDANGATAVYAEGSKAGQRLARLFVDEVAARTGVRKRALEPVSADKTPDGRWIDGRAYMVWGMPQPAIFAEPGFLSNTGDMGRLLDQNKAGLMLAYVATIETFAAELTAARAEAAA